MLPESQSFDECGVSELHPVGQHLSFLKVPCLTWGMDAVIFCGLEVFACKMPK